VLILKKKFRSEFKKPIGELYKSLDEAENVLVSKKMIISVGDVTTRNLQEKGLIPNMAIIDNQIERKPAQHDIIYDNVTLKARNPPGFITDELWETVLKGYKLTKTGYRVLIIVEGEEDLAVIPSVILAPEGSLVLYGQPGEGVVICEVDLIKDKVVKMKQKLEEE
jgi:uncharacterized protein (UPF0218 family)